MNSLPRNGPTLASTAIVDSSVLYAAADQAELDHARCADLLETTSLTLAFPTLVIAEVAYLVGSRIGAAAERQFVEHLSQLEIEPPSPSDWLRIPELLRRYADLPLGTTDASVVAVAERLGSNTIYTLDRKHFSVVKPKHTDAFELLPA